MKKKFKNVSEVIIELFRIRDKPLWRQREDARRRCFERAEFLANTLELKPEFKECSRVREPSETFKKFIEKQSKPPHPIPYLKKKKRTANKE